jgi:hypothetical protein
MKTLDINARSWYDKVNGNSYFSAEIVLDYGTETDRRYFLPFQYGYGDHYQYETINELKRQKEIDNKITMLYQLRDEQNVIVRASKIDTLKRNLKEENY